MSYEEVFAQVQETMRQVFKKPGLVIERHMAARDVPEWTSLGHVLLIAELEKVYEFRFGLTDMLDIQTVDDICNKVLELIERS